MGIGNEHRCDDGIGMVLARNFDAPGWISLACATAPENFTSVVKRHNPQILVMVDAAQLDLAPGAFRRVPPERIADVSVGTHSLPLSVVMDYLRPSVSGEIIFVGIQPGNLADGETLSPEVRDGAATLATLLGAFRFDDIPGLGE
jgi:hydrogenase 3 maturation protease